jgi:hypothetical protein
MKIDTLMAELERRSKLWDTLDAYISTHFMSEEGSFLNRGCTQQQIINDLGLKNTGYMRREVNERMTQAGFRPIAYQGQLCYRGVRWL